MFNPEEIHHTIIDGKHDPLTCWRCKSANPLMD